ncbi:MAG: CvpA family protein [Chitinophagaceae bacterium]|nr:CvpA family protein [Chitinophagaceae bacterium]
MIDIVFLVLMALAVWKGYSKGLVVALFSFVGMIVGMLLALKCSAMVAIWLGEETKLDAKWLPFLAFLLIIIGVYFGVRILAALVQKSLEFAMLGWANRIGGILLYALLYSSLLTLVLFYADKLQLLSADAKANSQFYHFMHGFAKPLLSFIADALPFIKNILQQLSDFFAEQPASSTLIL